MISDYQKYLDSELPLLLAANKNIMESCWER